MSHINYSKLALVVIIDAYVTRNAIEDFIENPPSCDFKEIKKQKYISYLEKELHDINSFLKDNLYFDMLNMDEHMFLKYFPDMKSKKRKLVWFKGVNHIPFTYSTYLNKISG